MKIRLPALLEFFDYGELWSFHFELKKIIPGVKFKQIEVDDDFHYAIFYIGKQDTKYKKLYKETIAKREKFRKEQGYY